MPKLVGFPFSAQKECSSMGKIVSSRSYKPITYEFEYRIAEMIRTILGMSEDFQYLSTTMSFLTLK